VARSTYRLPEKIRVGPRDEGRSSGIQVLDGYVRVSSVGLRAGPRFISARQQEAQIRAYAAAHGHVLGRVFVELNRSGRSHRRPALQSVLDRITSGESGGVIVVRLDRLGRSVAGALHALATIEAGGGNLVSIEDGLNLRTPFGRAFGTILLALAELELDRLAASASESRRRMVARGVHHSALPPTGYLRAPGKALGPDPRQAPLVVEAFERRAAGATYAEVATFLREAEVVNARGDCAWTSKAVYKMLQNPVYVGEAFAATARNTDAHPPLVRRGLWLAALAASTSARAKAHGSTLLAGLIRCAGCCHVLGKNQCVTRGGRRLRNPAYRCRRYHRAGECMNPASAAGTLLDAAVVEALLGQLDANRPRADHEAALSAAEDELREAELHARSHPGWRSAYTDTDDNAVARARARVLSLWRRQGLAALPTAAELRRRWKRMTLAEQRQTLAAALETVILFPGSEPPAERIQLLFAGAPRDWYPKPGVRSAMLPFDQAIARPPQIAAPGLVTCSRATEITGRS
jgi:DNA invertase Pin-like site-specific DNA recombinase